MGWFSSTWGDRAREHDRDRKADLRDRKRRQRAAKARRRKEWTQHPARTAWRSR